MKTQNPAIDTPTAVLPVSTAPPSLETGDHLTRAEFERRWDALPHLKKAELLEGVVYVPSPVRFRRHGKPNAQLIVWLGHYEVSTPGVETADNASARLDLDNEPQPDGMLIISPECGGQAVVSADDYIEGGPELAAEVASSSVSIDLNLKFHIYRRSGVQEYLVWSVLDQKVDWFRLREGQFERLLPDAAGILRSEMFPGLWLDAAALLHGDMKRVLAVLDQGTSTAEHAAFIRQLQQAKKPAG